MFRNILVPTDLTKESERALEIAVKMTSKKGPLNITLLHIIEIINDADDKEFEEFYNKLRDRARKSMHEMAEQFQDDNVFIDEKILFGNRVREIVRYAHDNDTELIILSSHRIDESDMSQGWATISYKVGILAHCPVMMVK